MPNTMPYPYFQAPALLIALILVWTSLALCHGQSVLRGGGGNNHAGASPNELNETNTNATAVPPQQPLPALQVYILAGQSNMQGHAQLYTIPAIGRDPDPAVAALLEELVVLPANNASSSNASSVIDRNDLTTIDNTTQFTVADRVSISTLGY